MPSYLRLAFPAVLAFASIAAHADTFAVSYLGAGVQASTNSTYVETFNSAAVTNHTFTSNFNGSGIMGTYTGSFTIASADVWGGAGGTGNYITTNSSYTLSLNGTVNYFGMWFSALDNGNQLSFYNGSSLVFSFSPANYAALVGACPTTAASPNFCGNPNASQSGNGSQQYAFLNFYDSNGAFNKVVFTESPVVGGFESDNHTLGNLSSAPGGTSITATPEPGTLTLMGTGMAAAIGVVRRRLARRG